MIFNPDSIHSFDIELYFYYNLFILFQIGEDKKRWNTVIYFDNEIVTLPSL